jgi:hypothetical protein
MSDFSKKSNFEKLFFILYFAFAFFDVIAEIFSSKFFLYVFKSLTLIVLLFLYWEVSNQRNFLFFSAIFFLLIARIYAISNFEEMLFLGMIAYFLYRLTTIYYIIKLIKLKDYIPFLLVIIPVLFLFFYLLTLISNLTPRTYYSIIVQIILISILAGITISHFFMNEAKKNDVWLLIFGLLSVTHTFILFIEKFYLLDLNISSFRFLAAVLNTGVCFSFYKFVIATEKLNDN